MPDRELLYEIVQSQLDMICRFRRDGTIVFANDAYARNIGEVGADLTGRNLWQYVTGEDRAHVEAQLALLTPHNVSVTIENRFETATGPCWTLWRNHALEFDGAGDWIIAQSTGIDITERKLLEEQLRLMVDELNHRVKNTLMVVQALAEQSFSSTGWPSEPVERFGERLSALAAAHTILSRGNWTGATLGEVVRQGLFAVADDARTTCAGPEILLSAKQVIPLIMVLHELATNALKYGSLSAAAGLLEVTWEKAADDLVALHWREREGPQVAPPSREGFGSKMIAGSVRHQLRGEFVSDYQLAGLQCRIAFPLTGGA